MCICIHVYETIIYMYRERHVDTESYKENQRKKDNEAQN